MPADKPIRVLVVDDHQMFAETLHAFLDRAPRMRVVGLAGTAQDALRIAAIHRPDVALVDFQLPDLSGVEVTRRLKALDAEVQVVIITAFTDPEVIAKAVEAGACGFVPKTQSVERVVHVIRSAAAGELVLPEGDFRRLVTRLAGARQRRSGGEPTRRLSEREVSVLQSIASGNSVDEVAQSLYISPLTVRSHLRNIVVKLGARSRLDAVTMALREGLIQLAPS